MVDEWQRTAVDSRRAGSRGRPPGDVPVASGQLVYGDGLSAATVRRLACDARIIPLVLGTSSEPLDVGRSERLVTRAMRRALNARDQGCVICGVPPIMCDAHHLRSWIDGGETKTSNLVLLCRRHHVDLHHGQWSVTITDGLVEVARPSWAEPPPRQHRSRRRRRADHPAGDSVVPISQRSRTKADEADGSRSSADKPQRSRWRADEAVLRQAADFALADVPAG